MTPESRSPTDVHVSYKIPPPEHWICDDSQNCHFISVEMFLPDQTAGSMLGIDFIHSHPRSQVNVLA